MSLQNIWDGALSLGAAVITFCICGLPAWFTHKAVQAGAAPQWAYVAAGGLVVVGVVLTLAFVRKGFAGVAPSRQRRR